MKAALTDKKVYALKCIPGVDVPKAREVKIMFAPFDRETD